MAIVLNPQDDNPWIHMDPWFHMDSWSHMDSMLPPNIIYYLPYSPFSTSVYMAAQPLPPPYLQPYQPPLMPFHQPIHLYNNINTSHVPFQFYEQSTTNVQIQDYGFEITPSQDHQNVETFQRKAASKKGKGSGYLPPPRFRRNSKDSNHVTKVWTLKGTNSNNNAHDIKDNDLEEVVQEHSSGSSIIAQQIPNLDDDSKNTSVMVRNIPNQIRREELLMFLDFYCTRHQLGYDFLYLPMDFMSHNNFGYAFVNFTTSYGASKIMSLLDGHNWRSSHLKVKTSNKICRVSWARIQGKEALVKNFQESNFWCDEKEYLPVVFSPPRNGSSCLSNPSTIGQVKGNNTTT